MDIERSLGISLVISDNKFEQTNYDIFNTSARNCQSYCCGSMFEKGVHVGAEKSSVESLTSFTNRGSERAKAHGLAYQFSGLVLQQVQDKTRP